eukprot:1158614-Prymnesium_polylepis.2
MGRTDHDNNIFHHGPRDGVTLTVVTDDPSSERIKVQCSVCDKVFSIPRSSKGREVYNAKAVHCKPVNKPVSSSAISTATTLACHERPSAATWHTTVADNMSPMVVPSTCEGRRFLKHAKVDDVVLSVQREDSGGISMLHAKMVDQTLRLLGAEVPQATGYPQVMYNKGSVVDLEHVLRKCSKQFHRSKAYRRERIQATLESNKEWRERVEAFSLLADPKVCRPEDFTADNLDKCIDLLCDTLPHDPDNGLYDEHGDFIANPPRPGSHVPAHYRWDDSHNCILDYHPPGSVDSPVNLLPILIDVVSRDRRSYRHECILQLQSGEYIKTWMSIYDEGPSCLSQMEKLFPQVRALLERPVFKVAFWEGEAFPPPERIVPKLANRPRLTSNHHACLMLEYKNNGQETERPLTALLGLTKEDVIMPMPADDDGGAEQRLVLKREILESKARECLDVIAVMVPDDAMLTPGIDVVKHYKLDGPTDQGPTLKSHTQRLLGHVGKLNLRVKPRKLPSFTGSVEELEFYITCDSLHRAIAAEHARQGDRGRAISLDQKSVDELEQYWATLTQ